MNERLRLPEIQVTPYPFFNVILYQARLTTRRAGQPTVTIGNKHMHLLRLHIHIKATDVPRILKMNEGGVEGDVGHAECLMGKNPLGTRKSQNRI
jgi:hypothetical protein